VGEFVGGVSLEGGYHLYGFIDVEIRWNRLIVWNFTPEAVQHTQATHCNTLQHMPIEGKIGVTVDRDKNEFGLFNSSSFFHKTFGEEMILHVRVLLKMNLKLNT